MGTHPIFESDFDCLTENKMVFRRLAFGFNSIRRASLLSRHSYTAPVTSKQQFFNKKEEEPEKPKEENTENEAEEPTIEGCLEEINNLKSELEKHQKLSEKHAEEEKEFKYKLANLAEEMKNQKSRLDREADKAKVF